MKLRNLFPFLLVFLATVLSVRPSDAAVTFKLEDLVISPGTTSGSFFVFILVDGADTGLMVTNVNVSAGLGAGSVGGGVTIMNAAQPAANALIPKNPDNNPVRPANTIQFGVAANIGEQFSAAPDMVLGPKRIATIPFTLMSPAVAGETISLDFINTFMGVPAPFNNYTDSNGMSFSNLTTLGTASGSITVSAVPEPGSMLALSVICAAGGFRHYRKKRKAKIESP